MAKNNESAKAPASLPQWKKDDPRQGEVFDSLLTEGTGQWTHLYKSSGEPRGHSIGLYSALLTSERAAPSLKSTSWDLMIGHGTPGFSQYFEDGEAITTYHRLSEDGVEPLVIYRDFHGVKPRELDLSEEFRLLFNLWEDRKSRTFYYIDDAGNLNRAVEIGESSVRVLTSLLRRYQAVRQLYFASLVDSTHWDPDLPSTDDEWLVQDQSVSLAYYRTDALGGSGRFSRLVGKKLIPPPSIDQCGFWPYEFPDNYLDFIIGVDDLGHEVAHSSNPSVLSNYFGANPGSPHYLTPVFFRRDVLAKYYANPDLYSVEDGYIRCAGLWGLRIDNDLSEHVMVFLGDLGRDIPYSEAQYWRSFNMPPQGKVSETLFKRAFLAEFADPQSIDLRFARAYEETINSWQEKYGWPLFKELHEGDRHVLAKLHIPLQDTQAEFDEQIGYLAKLLVDSLNEEALSHALGSVAKKKAGLQKLEAFLISIGVAEAKQLLTPIANIQGLRSRGAAHRKGSDFDITIAIGDLDRPAGFAKLLTEAVDVLDALRSHTPPPVVTTEKAEQ